MVHKIERKSELDENIEDWSDKGEGWETYKNIRKEIEETTGW